MSSQVSRVEQVEHSQESRAVSAKAATMTVFRSPIESLLFLLFIIHTLFYATSLESEEKQGKFVQNVITHLRNSISSGVTFSREISIVPEGSSFDLVFGDNHCTSQDQFGDNECHFDWGETVRGNYKLLLTEELDAGDT